MVPAPKGEYVRFELRSPDPTTNPYSAYALWIYAGLDGIRKQIPLCEPLDQNLFIADQSVTDTLEKLPANLKEAIEQANQSSLIQQYIPDILD